MLLLNRTLLKMSKGLWGWMLAIVALKMAALVWTTTFAKTISQFLGNIDSPSLTAAQGRSAVISALIAAGLMFLFELLAGEAEYRCTAKARTNLRQRIFSKVLELDVGNIERVGPVFAITASVDGVESMQVYYSKYLPGLLYCICAPVYLFFQLYAISLPVAVILLAAAVLLLPLNNFFRVRIEKLKSEYWDSMQDLTGYYLESIRGLTTLKLFRQDQPRTSRLKDKAFSFSDRIMALMRVNFSSFLVTEGLLYGAVVISAGIACASLARGTMPFASALMVLLLSYSFFSAVRQLINVTHTALAGVAAAEKVSQLLATDSSRPYDPNIPAEPNPYAGIRLEKVCYAYSGRNAALKEVCIDIPRGKTIALAGLSGCGKSTVAGLLMRFFDPSGGRILIDGKDYRSLTPEELRRHIIMVPQSVSLFSGTVAENLRIAAKDASDIDLLEALEQVRLKDWVLSQPKGLDTDVGDAGSKLSGGQRQKIGIARALLSRAEYIIFDEATSSVDRESEQEIWNCIGELALTRTLIIISHRLSTIQDADCIYILSGGEVSEHGRHGQLMQQDGLYRRLVTEQARLEEQWEGGAAQ